MLQASLVFGQHSTLELTYEYLNVGQGETAVVTVIVNNLESLSVMAKADTTGAKNWDFNIDGDDAAGRQVYRNAANGELMFRDFVARNGTMEPCLVRDPLKYTWKYEPTTRKIGQYKCQSAQTRFRGRTYTAWYTEEIAVPCGPWKFAGLPGAMVEIQSDDGAISFRLLKVSRSEMKITRPGEATEISMKDYVALRERSVDDFINQLSAKLPRGAQITVNRTGDNNLETSFEDVKK